MKEIEKIRLDELEGGELFQFNGTIALKSEYRTKGGACECFIVGSGEMFWGGTQTAEGLNALMVEPYSLPPSNTQEQGEETIDGLKQELIQVYHENIKLTKRNTALQGQVQDLEQQLSSLKSKPNTTEAVSGWISVEDGLPEMKTRSDEHGNRFRTVSQVVIAYDGVEDEVFTTYFSEDIGFSNKNITHWMLFPAPPKPNNKQ